METNILGELKIEVINKTRYLNGSEESKELFYRISINDEVLVEERTLSEAIDALQYVSPSCFENN